MTVKIYFDTTCWVRMVENDLNKQFLEKEKESILEIQDIVENNKDKFEFISSNHQLQQLDNKLENPQTSDDQLDPLLVVIASCKVHAGETSDYDPPSSTQMANELAGKVNLPDFEDVKHIAIAWIKEVNYFVTVDWTTILNLNQNKMIENALDSMWHPTLHFTAKPVEIFDANSFLAYIKNDIGV